MTVYDSQLTCPICGERKTRCVDSRGNSDGTHIRRRKQCRSCKYVFSTREVIVMENERTHDIRGSLESLRLRLQQASELAEKIAL